MESSALANESGTPDAAAAALTDSSEAVGRAPLVVDAAAGTGAAAALIAALSFSFAYKIYLLK